MAKPELLVDFIISLDGYGAAHGWPGYWGLEGPEYLAWLEGQPEGEYLVLMGANTYRLMYGFTSQVGTGELRDDEEGSVDELTRAEKVVFSSTLQDPLPWANTRLVRGDAVEAVREMKRDGGRSMRTLGSLSLCRSLLRAGLVDRYRVVVFPVITGATGYDRIYDGYPDVALDMIASRTFDGRLQLLEYVPRVLEGPPGAWPAVEKQGRSKENQMASLSVLYMSMSLDGYIAGPNDGPDNPGGDGFMRLHEWYGFEGSPPNTQGTGWGAYFMEEANTTGAVLAGRRTVEQVDHWGGDHHGVPIFVPSHRPPGPSAERYPLVTYVSDGIERAMALAKAAAQGRNVMVHGAYTAQRALEAGVLDELQIHQIPVLFGGGRRLFDTLPERVELEIVRVIDTPEATHIRYRVRR